MKAAEKQFSNELLNPTSSTKSAGSRVRCPYASKQCEFEQPFRYRNWNHWYVYCCIIAFSARFPLTTTLSHSLVYAHLIADPAWWWTLMKHHLSDSYHPLLIVDCRPLIILLNMSSRAGIMSSKHRMVTNHRQRWQRTIPKKICSILEIYQIFTEERLLLIIQSLMLYHIMCRWCYSGTSARRVGGSANEQLPASSHKKNTTVKTFNGRIVFVCAGVGSWWPMPMPVSVSVVGGRWTGRWTVMGDGMDGWMEAMIGIWRVLSSLFLPSLFLPSLFLLFWGAAARPRFSHFPYYSSTSMIQKPGSALSSCWWRNLVLFR